LHRVIHMIRHRVNTLVVDEAGMSTIEYSVVR